MLAALRAKFSQHHQLRTLLLGTGCAQLIEHTRNDSYWGDGGDGSGQNMLGKLLMQVRGELSEGAPLEGMEVNRRSDPDRAGFSS